MVTQGIYIVGTWVLVTLGGGVLLHALGMSTALSFLIAAAVGVAVATKVDRSFH